MMEQNNDKHPFLWHFVKPVSKTLSATNAEEIPATERIGEGNNQTFVELCV